MMTSATYQPGSSAARGLWVAALFVVLAGLFVMHGLGGHGSGDLAGSSMATSTVSGGHGHSAGHPASTMLTALDTTPPSLSDGPAVSPMAGAPAGSMPGGMAGMCKVVLSGLLLALLWLLGSAPRSCVVWGAPRLRPVPSVGRTPAPPSLAQLSILRC